MKKFIITIGSFASVATPIVAVISCGEETFPETSVLEDAIEEVNISLNTQSGWPNYPEDVIEVSMDEAIDQAAEPENSTIAQQFEKSMEKYGEMHKKGKRSMKFNIEFEDLDVESEVEFFEDADSEPVLTLKKIEHYGRVFGKEEMEKQTKLKQSMKNLFHSIMKNHKKKPKKGKKHDKHDLVNRIKWESKGKKDIEHQVIIDSTADQEKIMINLSRPHSPEEFMEEFKKFGVDDLLGFNVSQGYFGELPKSGEIPIKSDATLIDWTKILNIFESDLTFSEIGNAMKEDGIPVQELKFRDFNSIQQAISSSTLLAGFLGDRFADEDTLTIPANADKKILYRNIGSLLMAIRMLTDDGLFTADENKEIILDMPQKAIKFAFLNGDLDESKLDAETLLQDQLDVLETQLKDGMKKIEKHKYKRGRKIKLKAKFQDMEVAADVEFKDYDALEDHYTDEPEITLKEVKESQSNGYGSTTMVSKSESDIQAMAKFKKMFEKIMHSVIKGHDKQPEMKEKDKHHFMNHMKWGTKGKDDKKFLTVFDSTPSSETMAISLSRPHTVEEFYKEIEQEGLDTLLNYSLTQGYIEELPQDDQYNPILDDWSQVPSENKYDIFEPTMTILEIGKLLKQDSITDDEIDFFDADGLRVIVDNDTDMADIIANTLCHVEHVVLPDDIDHKIVYKNVSNLLIAIQKFATETHPDKFV